MHASVLVLLLLHLPLPVVGQSGLPRYRALDGVLEPVMLTYRVQLAGVEAAQLVVSVLGMLSPMVITSMFAFALASTSASFTAEAAEDMVVAFRFSVFCCLALASYCSLLKNKLSGPHLLLSIPHGLLSTSLYFSSNNLPPHKPLRHRVFFSQSHMSCPWIFFTEPTVTEPSV